MNYCDIAKEHKSELIALLKELVQINSVYDEATISDGAPFGQGIKKALDLMLAEAIKDGFIVENVDGYAGRIILEGKEKERIAILGHLDVVPVGEGWTYPPFGAEIHDGKLYGRGATDDKGPVVASYIALKALKEAGFKPNKTIELILGTDEETGWRGLAYYQTKYDLPKVGFSPDAEFPLINGEKGILRMTLTGPATSDFTLKGGEIFNAVIGKAVATTKVDLIDEFEKFLKKENLAGDATFDGEKYIYTLIGKTAHAMAPQNGINAGTYLACFLNQHFNHPTLELIANNLHLDFNLNKLGLKTTHPVMGIITNNIGIMDFNNKETKFTFDIRYPEGFEFSRYEEALKNIFGVYGVSFVVNENKVPHYVDPNSSLVQTLYHIYVKHSGDTVNKPMCIGGGTYARALECGVAYGMEDPTKQSVCHIADEYVELDRLMMAFKIYMEAIYELGK